MKAALALIGILAAAIFWPSQQPVPAAATPQPIQFTPPPLPERRRRKWIALFWQFRLLTVPLVLVSALAIGLAAWAFTTTNQERSTGAFTVDAEGTSIEVLTRQMGGDSNDLEAGTDWCKGDSLTQGSPLYCSMTVRNRTTTNPVNYSLRTPTINNADAKNLAGSLQVTIRAIPGMPSACKAAHDGGTGTVVYNGKLAAEPKFGDPAPGPQAGDRSLTADTNPSGPPPAGNEETLCLKIEYTTPVVYSATTSAVFRIDADDGP